MNFRFNNKYEIPQSWGKYFFEWQYFEVNLERLLNDWSCRNRVHFMDKLKYDRTIYVCFNLVLVVIMIVLYVTSILQILWKNQAENMHQKLITQNNQCMQEDILKEDYKKVKKVNYIFISNPTPFNGQDHEKQNGPGTL